MSNERKYDPTERVGINAVESIVLNELKWIWREQPVVDYGVDAYIESAHPERGPTGQLLAVQVKTGPSYFRGSGATIPFYVSHEHLRYWDQHSLPVILVLHDPASKVTVWQWASVRTARATEKRWCIDIPRDQIFSAAAKEALLDQVWNDDALGLRHRFALDRPFMRQFVDQEAFVRIDKWVNKSLSFRGIDIRFDDPDKDTADYEIPMYATWHYDVEDLMHHFLPWLDYEYHEAVDDSSGEIESHVFSVELSKVAKAFLEVEAFFEDPPGHKTDEPLAEQPDYDPLD